MRVCAFKLGQLCHTDGDLGYTRTTLAEKTIRCKPWSSGTLLDILAESDINGIVVFRYIPTDVIEASITHLDVDIASEYQF